MLQGSSALLYESQRQILTPSVKLTMKDGSRFLGLSQMWNKFQFDDAIEWNGFYIGVGTTTRTDYARVSVVTWDKGLSTLAYTNLGLYANSGSGGGGKFLNTGLTLMLFTRGSSGDGLNIVFSTGGTAWGNTEGMSMGGASILDMQPTGTTRVYITLRTFHDNELSNALGSIVAVANKGISFWGRTNIYTQYLNKPNFPPRSGRIVGRTVNNEDILLLMYGKARTSFGELTGDDGIKMIKADGYNSYFDRDLVIAGIFSPGQGVSRSTSIDLSNMALGNSTYYFVTNRIIQTNLGNAGTQTTPMITSIHRSTDLIHWSSGELIGTGNSMFRNVGIISGSTTNNPMELIINAGNTDWAFVGRGITSVDLSPYVQNYSNDNNERISITLGNMQ